jgi:hypothetical protein
MLWKMSFGQGLGAGQVGAELPYQVPTHTGSLLSLPSSAKCMDPIQ